MSKKYLKWVFGTNIANKENEKFEIGKVITADTWDPYNDDWDRRGGFNFTNEECSLRWMSRGDTLYEVELPSDAELVEVKNNKTPGGIFIANKIILKNPIPISDDLLRDFYKKSELPLSTYFECIGLLASRGYYELALMIIKDKVNKENIDNAIDKVKKALKPWHEGNIDYDTYNKVVEELEEIKSPLLINRFIDKKPYIKKLTDDNIINLTGQSGSGKSYYANEHFKTDDYLIIDTDDIFSDARFDKAKGINKELGVMFRKKYKKLPDLGNDFDLIYEDILNYCKGTNKTIVIDCAQFHCIKDIGKLKGTIIIIRTCIDTCYNRTISRWLKQHKEYKKEDLEKYKQRKKSIYNWYKYTNTFIEKVDKIKKYRALPNKETFNAINSAYEGDGKVFNSVDDLLNELNK